jgi:serine/threonine protein phosphatase 1
MVAVGRSVVDWLDDAGESSDRPARFLRFAVFAAESQNRSLANVPRNYDHEKTFESYLGRDPRHDDWEADLLLLRDAIPVEHRRFLADLPWLVEAPGHLFLHNGLSPELEQSAEEQVEALRQRRWDDTLRPRAGTKTAELWQTHYPAWLGADRRLSNRPLPCEDRVQVTGHVWVPKPEGDAVRIRLDTSGGYEHNPLTACLLQSASAEPVFIASR